MERSVSAAGFLANTQQNAIFPSLGLRVPKTGLRNAGLSVSESPNLSGCSFRLKVGRLAFDAPDLPSGVLGSHDPRPLSERL